MIKVWVLISAIYTMSGDLVEDSHKAVVFKNKESCELVKTLTGMVNGHPNRKEGADVGREEEIGVGMCVEGIYHTGE